MRIHYLRFTSTTCIWNISQYDKYLTKLKKPHLRLRSVALVIIFATYGSYLQYTTNTTPWLRSSQRSAWKTLSKFHSSCQVTATCCPTYLGQFPTRVYCNIVPPGELNNLCGSVSRDSVNIPDKFRVKIASPKPSKTLHLIIRRMWTTTECARCVYKGLYVHVLGRTKKIHKIHGSEQRVYRPRFKLGTFNIQTQT